MVKHYGYKCMCFQAREDKVLYYDIDLKRIKG